MKLGEYYTIRTAVQDNAPRGDLAAVQTMAEDLSDALESTGLFHTVEVDRTDDPDRLVIAMVGFTPGASALDVNGALLRVWHDRVGYRFWAAETTLVERDHVEFQGATRAGADGHFVTVHVVAQACPVPVRPAVVAPATNPAPRPVAETMPVHVPAHRPARGFGRLFGRPALAPAL